MIHDKNGQHTALSGYLLIFFTVLAVFGVGCTPRFIEGTKIEDSDDTRDVIKVMETYRKAMESRDADMLIALTSKNYFEKNGDSNSKNNYDYEGLVKLLRSPEFRRISSLRMKIVYRNIDFSEKRDVVTVRYYYTSDFKMPPPAYDGEDDAVAKEEQDDNYDEEVWHSKNDDNEMILEKVEGKWYILKGM